MNIYFHLLEHSVLLSRSHTNVWDWNRIYILIHYWARGCPPCQQQPHNGIRYRSSRGRGAAAASVRYTIKTFQIASSSYRKKNMCAGVSLLINLSRIIYDVLMNSIYEIQLHVYDCERSCIHPHYRVYEAREAQVRGRRCNQTSILSVDSSFTRYLSSQILSGGANILLLPGRRVVFQEFQGLFLQ